MAVGTEYFYMIYKDKQAELGFDVTCRIENETIIDSTLNDGGNYFHTREECEKRIEKISKKP